MHFNLGINVCLLTAYGKRNKSQYHGSRVKISVLGDGITLEEKKL